MVIATFAPWNWSRKISVPRCRLVKRIVNTKVLKATLPAGNP